MPKAAIATPEDQIRELPANWFAPAGSPGGFVTGTPAEQELFRKVLAELVGESLAASGGRGNDAMLIVGQLVDACRAKFGCGTLLAGLPADIAEIEQAEQFLSENDSAAVLGAVETAEADVAKAETALAKAQQKLADAKEVLRLRKAEATQHEAAIKTLAREFPYARAALNYKRECENAS